MEQTAWEAERDHYWWIQKNFRLTTIAAIEELLPLGYPLPVKDHSDDSGFRLGIEFAEALPAETIDRIDEMLIALDFADWHEAKQYLLRLDYHFIINGRGN